MEHNKKRLEPIITNPNKNKIKNLNFLKKPEETNKPGLDEIVRLIVQSIEEMENLYKLSFFNPELKKKLQENVTPLLKQIIHNYSEDSVLTGVNANVKDTTRQKTYNIIKMLNRRNRPSFPLQSEQHYPYFQMNNNLDPKTQLVDPVLKEIENMSAKDREGILKQVFLKYGDAVKNNFCKSTGKQIIATFNL